MTALFEAYTIEAKFDEVNWVDIKNDIVSDIKGKGGILTSDAQSRIADVGELSFDLNNTETNSAGLVGYYSPEHPNCRAGFAPGLEVRFTATLSGRKVQKWIGRITMEGIKPQAGVYSARRTSVVVKDWMEQTSIHELKGVAFTTDKTPMEGVALVLANMNIQPPGTTDYHTAESTFKTLFDMTRSNTTALSEFAKMMQSELGYLYLTRQGLRVEGRLTRNEEKIVLDDYPKARVDLGFLINENDDYIVNENGHKILISNSDQAIFVDVQSDADVTFGTNYFNEVKFVAYPRRVDAAATTILFNLQSPMEIQAGETIIISGRYKDPTGVAQSVSGINMVTPAATTHYLAFANKDGSGTNLTANLTVTASFGTGEFQYTIANSGAAGWITKATAVGKGVYTDQPVEYVVQDAAGIAKYGKRTMTIDMKYQDDASMVRYWAQVKLFQYSSLMPYINSVKIKASRAMKYLYAFLYIEPGDRIRLSETVTGISRDFFVHGYEFVLKRGGILDFNWILKSAGLDTWNFVKWIADDVTIPTYGTWDDPIYGWDF